MQQAIGESELILTDRGTIYHLDLAPHQIADTIITVGDPDRVGQVSKYFDSVEHKAQHREFVTHTGRIGSKRISVVGTGIGPDNIDIVLNELDALVNIDFSTRTPFARPQSLNLIRMGTCGSLQADVPVDSLVVSTHGIGLDNLMHYYPIESTENEVDLLEKFVSHTGLKSSRIVPYVATGSQKLLAHFSDGYVSGITVTCPGFYGPQGRVLRGGVAFPQLIDQLSTFTDGTHRITNFEMETSAIYGLGSLLGHQCLSINTVVANRILKNFSKDGAKAVEGMIRKSLEIISGL
ncbi:MAG: nucleoside phosphorylase [Bacteroidetes bacterium]|nr:nucleoside phosphorylase [Bacteroidota bacterium]MBS1740142.1 nucleoside phosphorylase [Bacteroidota bacterium]MBS1775369.1 nucleoside phosphorylase [Bacteroidota bacterium]